MATEKYEQFATGGSANLVFGPTLASATTIAVTHRYHKVSGTTTIQTITPPWTNFNGEVVLIPTGVFSLGTSGNILNAFTGAVDKSIVLHYDGTKWRVVLGDVTSSSVTPGHAIKERAARP